MKKGFTIIELVIATIVMVSIGTMIAAIITSSLRGTNKTNITTAVTQNGNNALSIMTNIIHDSDAVVTPNGTQYVSTRTCTGSDPNDNTYVMPVGSSIYLHRLDGGITLLSCALPAISSSSASLTPGTIQPPVYLIDTVQVRTTFCSISCSQADVYSPPIINISFALTGSNVNTSVGFENTASTSFSTQVSMLNYHPQ